MKRWIPSVLALTVLLVPVLVFAQDQGRTLTVGVGSPITMEQLIGNVVSYLSKAIVYLCTALFLIGAFLLIISRGEGQNLERGKGLIIGSLLGLAVTLGAAAIIHVVYSFLYSA